MSAQQIQIPDIDISKPETLLIRYALLRNVVRQLDDELTGMITEIQRQIKLKQEEARQAAIAAASQVEASKPDKAESQA